VSVQGSDTPGYVIKVGEATDVLTTEMRNEANQLTEQAETLGSYLGEDTLMRDRVTATEELTERATSTTRTGHSTWMRSTTVTDTLIRDSRYTGKISTIRRRIACGTSQTSPAARFTCKATAGRT